MHPKTFIVKVHLLSQSEPVTHTDVHNSYQKGDLYCVMVEDRTVYKYPLANIFRVTETQGAVEAAKACEWCKQTEGLIDFYGHPMCQPCALIRESQS